MYKLVDNIELNTAQIKDNLLKDGGLCAGCERRINAESMMASFTNEEGVYYYLVCKKCVNMLNKVDNFLKNNKKIIIEERLFLNIHLYAAILIKENSFKEDKDEEQIVSILNDNKASWITEDLDYFQKNSDIKFRYRKIYMGELEETYESKSHLKEDAKNKNIQYAIVHNIGNGKTIKSFINKLSDEYPTEDQYFIAALFIILINKIDPEKINDIYKDIKERKEIFSGFESLKINY